MPLWESRTRSAIFCEVPGGVLVKVGDQDELMEAAGNASEGNGTEMSYGGGGSWEATGEGTELGMGEGVIGESGCHCY